MATHTITFDRPLKRVLLVASKPAVPAEPAPAESVTDHESTFRLLDQIADGIQGLNQQSAMTREDMLQTSIALTRMVVDRLVGGSTSLQEARLRSLLEEALRTHQQPLAIHLNAADLATFEGELRERESVAEVNLVADATVPAGEVRLAYPTYDLVSSLQQQMDDIERMLQELVHEP